MKPQLSVVICTYNRAVSLKKTLESLVKQTRRDFEVILIDGGSDDNTEKVFQSFRGKLTLSRYIFEEKSLSKVRDLGWRKARADIVTWTDDDVVIDRDWVKNILLLMTDQTIGGVSGPTIIPDSLVGKRDVFSFYNSRGIKGLLGKTWDTLFLEGGRFTVGKVFRSGAWSPGSNFTNCLTLPDTVEVDYLEACNMSLRRKLVKKVDGFDYSFTGVGEWSELDLACRVKKLGYRLVFSPKIRVSHHVSTGGIFSKRTGAKSRMENFLLYYFRHVYEPRWGHLWRFGLYLIFLNGYWTYKAFSSGNIDWLGGWIGTVTGFFKLK